GRGPGAAGAACPCTSAPPVATSNFFFQAEDGIRDFHVTGVQTCALPICGGSDAGTPPGVNQRRKATSRQGRGGGLRGQAAGVMGRGRSPPTPSGAGGRPPPVHPASGRLREPLRR